MTFLRLFSIASLLSHVSERPEENLLSLFAKFICFFLFVCLFLFSFPEDFLARQPEVIFHWSN